MKPILAPSLLAADFSCLDRQVEIVEKAGAQWLHLDIMDFHFVPNLTFGAGIVSSLRSCSDMVFDAHLMVEDPFKFIESFKKAGADYFTFHIEAAENPDQIIRDIKSAGMRCGISIKPSTDISVLLPYLADLDLVLVMSVEPGFGGQSFMPDMLEKSSWLAAEKVKNGYSYIIEMDGGINRENAKKALASGVEALVAGSAVFGAEDIAKEVRYYLDLTIDR